MSVICLVSCSSSCKNFEWEPRPYSGNSLKQTIESDIASDIRCDEPAFDEVTCFDAANIAELITAIGEVKNKKLRKKLINKVNKFNK